MPKEKRSHQRRHGFGSSPYRSSLRGSKATASTTSEEKSIEWKEVRCPICIEHPHNAILLICSSHSKGCRPFMCDTSYRHSNCFDQYCKRFKNDENTPSPGILCPLCRGDVKEWIVVEKARRYFNEKPRTCACDTCGFSGTYQDLRKHARCAHPGVRPSKADARRERDWRRLEWRRDIGDLLSILQFDPTNDGEDDELSTVDQGGWFTFFVLVTLTGTGTGTSRSTRLRITRPSIGLWGETLEGEAASPHDVNESEPFVDDAMASQ